MEKLETLGFRNSIIAVVVACGILAGIYFAGILPSDPPVIAAASGFVTVFGSFAIVVLAMSLVVKPKEQKK